MELNKNQKIYISLLIIILFIFGGFILYSYHKTEKTSEDKNIANYTKTPNPAAVYCTKLGYKYKIITNPDGSQYGICVFPNNQSCDAWDFIRGKCGQNYTYCEKRGGTIISKQNGSSQYAICKLPSGKECKEFEYFEGRCP